MPAPRDNTGRYSHTKPRRRHAMRLGKHHVKLPRSRFLRLLLGSGLVLGGCLWFLPVLGLWMLPLGVAVLSIDLPPVRRLRRRLAVKWGRSHMRHRANGWSARSLRQWRKIWPGLGK